MVTLLPFSPEGAGIANVKGDLHVYSSEICSCCHINTFCPKGSSCGYPFLAINLTCHDASSWPYAPWYG